MRDGRRRGRPPNVEEGATSAPGEGADERTTLSQRTRLASAVVYERVFVSALPRIRGFVALRFFAAIYPDFTFGRGARSWGKVLILMSRGSTITIGDDLWLISDQGRAGIALHSPCKIRTISGAEVVLGDRVGLNGTSITSRLKVTIGSGTIIAANVVIVDSDFHKQWPADARWTSDGSADDEPVAIGENVWIGMGTIVLKGAVIGDNSIIGAGSVVTGPIPGNVVAAGVPARVIRRLGA